MSISQRIVRTIGQQVRRPLRKLGYDLVAARDVASPDVRMHWIGRLGVDLVIDVGANLGQFVGWIRDRGYRGPLISFEPQEAAFSSCKEAWVGDSNWWGYQTALGEEDGSSDFHVAGNSMSSSLLPMLESHVVALPESAIVSTGRVPVTRLDRITHHAITASKSIFLKIDTQGYELPVLRGAKGLMDKVAFIEAELSIVPLYEGQVLMADMLTEIARLGFTMVWIEPGFSDQANARLLQVDGLFVRTSLLQTG